MRKKHKLALLTLPVLGLAGFLMFPAGRGLVSSIAGRKVHVPVQGTRNLYPGRSGFQVRIMRESIDKGNFCLSPLSVYACLGLAYAGSQGQTRKVMMREAGFPESADSLFKGYAALDSRMRLAEDEGIQWNWGNSIWLDNAVEGNPDYIALADRWLDDAVKTVDLRNDKAGTVAEINDWISDITNGKLPSVLSEEQLREARNFVLVNALYFKGAWEVPFPRTATAELGFRVPAGRVKRTSMMLDERETGYYSDERVQVLELPFKANGLVMLVILPKPGRAKPASYLDYLGADKLSKLIGSIETRTVDIRLPKFEIFTTTQLTTPLKKMGLGELFGRTADFGILVREPVALNNVMQSCWIKVNEEGAEAAAVTTMVDSVTEEVNHQPIRFHADHPFLFALYDRTTKLLLFAGQVTDPTEGEEYRAAAD